MSGESVRQRARDTWEDRAQRYIREQYAPEIAAKLLADWDITVAMAFFAEHESSLARKQERDECQKIAETFAANQLRHGEAELAEQSRQIAAAIHERGRKVEG